MRLLRMGSCENLLNVCWSEGVPLFQEERLQHANLRPSGLRPLFLSTLLVFRWLLQCPIRTSSTVTATSQALTKLLRSYRTATRRNSSLPIRYTSNPQTSQFGIHILTHTCPVEIRTLSSLSVWLQIVRKVHTPFFLSEILMLFLWFVTEAHAPVLSWPYFGSPAEALHRPYQNL